MGQRRARVLVAEDSKTQALKLKILLAGAGYEPLMAVDGPSALQLVIAERPDAVISDVRMPGFSGYELCKRIRADPRLAPTPVLLMTRMSSVADVLDGLWAGADNFLTKPYDPKLLFARLEAALQHPTCGEPTQQALDFLLSTFESYRESQAHERETAAALADARLRAAEGEKHRAIGQLAAGLAHEINTPAQFVNDNIDFFEETLDVMNSVIVLQRQQYARLLAGETTVEAASLAFDRRCEEVDLAYLTSELPSALSQSRSGLQQVATIVTAMREFSTVGTKAKRPHDVNRAVRLAVTVTHGEWSDVAEVIEDCDLALPAVPCVGQELNQVFLRLLVNAGQAIRDVGSGRGEIRVRTRHESPWAVIEIGDTGCGIPAEAQSRVFEPFFTTRPVGSGRGEGLTIARAIVQRHGGDISFETGPGGTVFRVRLPLAPAVDSAGPVRQGNTMSRLAPCR